MKRIQIFASVVTLSLLTTGLMINYSRIRNNALEDNWLTKIPSGINAGQFKYITGPKVHEVLLPMRSHASQQLTHESVVEISAKQAEILIGERLKFTKRERIYLVRGVDPFDGEGTYTVLQRGTLLWVMSTALAKSVSTPIHRPLVLCLETQPTKVLISFSSAE